MLILFFFKILYYWSAFVIQLYQRSTSGVVSALIDVTPSGVKISIVFPDSFCFNLVPLDNVTLSVISPYNNYWVLYIINFYIFILTSGDA